MVRVVLRPTTRKPSTCAGASNGKIYRMGFMGHQHPAMPWVLIAVRGPSDVDLSVAQHQRRSLVFCSGSKDS